ncbi:MAG: DUF1003 domain-containing protein [Ekhidna sp.]
MEKHLCHIDQKEYSLDKLVSADVIKPQIVKLVNKDFDGFGAGKYIHQKYLEKYRKKYLEKLINSDGDAVTDIEREVLDSIYEKEILNFDLESELESRISLGDRAADKIAKFGGSWKFVISFFLFLIVWMAINVWILINHPFDPYPFILLNLILSCLAAIQAPIIMMSQNRKEQRDRMRSENDYKVNLKAEIEIRLLREKVDHMFEVLSQHVQKND